MGIARLQNWMRLIDENWQIDHEWMLFSEDLCLDSLYVLWVNKSVELKWVNESVE